MFVWTINWNKKTAVLVIIGIAALLAILIFASANNSGNGSSGKIGSVDDAAAFLESLGWTVDKATVEQKDVIIPKQFSDIYNQYNNIQKAQGYDLSDYRGMEVTIYSFDIQNYSGYSGRVVADVYVHNKKVIGGDIHSIELDGFMQGLSRNSK